SAAWRLRFAITKARSSRRSAWPRRASACLARSSAAPSRRRSSAQRRTSRCSWGRLRKRPFLKGRRSANGAWRSNVKRSLVFIAACLLPISLAAQAVTGTILGVVTDDTGGVIPGATVTLTHTGTGLVRTVVSDASGEYTAPSLPTGKYTVVAELTGFKKVTLPNVDLGVDQHVRINVKLEVGAMSEVMT